MDKLYIVIPAYNEELNIRNVVEQWHHVIENLYKNKEVEEGKLLFVDDGSKDSTLKLLYELKQEYPYLSVVSKENGGHGSSVLFGYRYALDNGADYIFQTDSDGQTNPNEFESFWKERTNYDAIIGNRNNRKDGASRVFVEKVLLLLLRIVFGVSMPDSNAPFRLMKASLLNKYINKLPENYNLPNAVLTAFFVYFNEKIKFINISFEPRTAGKNFINVRRIFKIGFNAIFDFIKIRIALNKK